jgi:hypothetical protein
MRVSRLRALAFCLSMGGLAIFGIWHVPTASAAAAAGAVSSQCQALPAPSASASPTPSPTATASASASASASPTAAASSAAPVDLCVSVQAAGDSVQQNQNADWTVQVWEQNGPVTGVTVTLTSSLAGQAATFTGKCPGGDGNTSCVVGDIGTTVTASSYQMQAQIAIPSGTAVGTSVSLTASANATPALPVQPSTGTAVSVTAAPSPSASASASKSATAAASTPAASSAATTPAASVPAASVPGVGTLPSLVAPVNPTSQVTAVSNPGSIGSLLPVITPAAYATSPTSGLVSAPAAAPAAYPGTTAQATNASSFVMVIPAADAEKIGLAILLLAVGVALGLRAKNGSVVRVLAGRAPRGAHHGSSVNRAKPSASDKANDKAGDKVSDKTSDKTSDKASDEVGDEVGDEASDEAGDSPKKTD